MAIEIKELVIKTTVVGSEQKQTSVSQEQLSSLKKEIMAHCSQYIKAAIKEQKER